MRSHRRGRSRGLAHRLSLFLLSLAVLVSLITSGPFFATADSYAAANDAAQHLINVEIDPLGATGKAALNAGVADTDRKPSPKNDDDDDKFTFDDAADDTDEDDADDDSEEESFMYFSNPPNQPLYIINDTFFSEQEFQSLRDCVLSHPLIGYNELNQNGFSTTKGLLIRWNKDGDSRLRAEPHLACLIPYYDKLRFDKANGFVMNILVAPPMKNAEEATKASVGRHIDDTLKLVDTEGSKPEFAAHEVSVLYIQVPEGLQGGALKIFTPDMSDGEESEDEEAEKKDETFEILPPKTGRLVRFRGDAPHEVLGCYGGDGRPRVSLILEQYKVPKLWYGATETFDCGHCERAKNGISIHEPPAKPAEELAKTEEEEVSSASNKAAEP